MLAAYLTQGIKAGLVAGVVLALFMAIVANPLVVHADETNQAAVDGHGGEVGEHQDTAASMTINKIVSVLSSGLWAVLLGGVVFGIAFYFLEPAIPGTGATKSFVLAAAGFITVSGAPWLVLPPASPGAQQSLAVNTRLLWYAGMMVAGAATCLLSGYVYKRVRASSADLLAGIAALVPFGLLAIPTVLAPTNDVVGALGPDLKAGILGLIVFGQVLVWLALAASHALLRTSGESGSRPSTADTEAAVSAD